MVSAGAHSRSDAGLPALDLSETVGVAVDRLIGLKFPAYLIPHPRKVIWLLHQHRQAYDLWQHPLNDLDRYAKRG